MFDFSFIRLLIEFIGALFIGGYAGGAFVVLLRYKDRERARLLVIEGALLGLSIKLAATLLKTIELHTWEQILMFTAILALRTLLKRVFLWEQTRLEAGNLQEKPSIGEQARHGIANLGEEIKGWINLMRRKAA